MNVRPASPAGGSTETGSAQQQAQHSQYALYAALQTMKKRCLTLQQRLTAVEEENLVLRQRNASATFHEPITRSGDRDQQQQLVNDMQLEVQQLVLARQQATDRLTMIAAENRQLWARLSQFTKPAGTWSSAADDAVLGADEATGADPAKTASPATTAAQTSPNTAHQNLIRSKTFTQNAPNPALRIKMAGVETTKTPRDTAGTADARSPDDLSLEEISLKVLNEFLEKKAEAEKLCADLNADFNTTSSTGGEAAHQKSAAANNNTDGIVDGNDSFGFGFLSDDAVATQTGIDLQMELKRCAEGMADIRKEVLNQQSDIKVALSSLRQRRFLDVCPSCQHHLRTTGNNKSTAANEAATPSTSDATSYAVAQPTAAPVLHAAVHIDVLEQKRLADQRDKMCPMCAKLYTAQTTFDAFREHVESHFLDDTDWDSSFDKNFELVSHTVGDF